jgi:hypothetical protein
MYRQLAKIILPMVVLAVVAVLTIGAEGQCCIGSFCLGG